MVLPDTFIKSTLLASKEAHLPSQRIGRNLHEHPAPQPSRGLVAVRMERLSVVCRDNKWLEKQGEAEAL
jgi:hypothetical protein